MSPPLKRGMTAAAFQSLAISDDTKEVEKASNRGCNNFCRYILERESPDCLAQLICRGPDFAALSEHQLLVVVLVQRV